MGADPGSHGACWPAYFGQRQTIAQEQQSLSSVFQLLTSLESGHVLCSHPGFNATTVRESSSVFTAFLLPPARWLNEAPCQLAHGLERQRQHLQPLYKDGCEGLPRSGVKQPGTSAGHCASRSNKGRKAKHRARSKEMARARATCKARCMPKGQCLRLVDQLIHLRSSVCHPMLSTGGQGHQPLLVQL